MIIIFLDILILHVHTDRPPIEKHVVHAPQVINEAYDYQKPSSFSRALRLDFGGYKVLLDIRNSQCE